MIMFIAQITRILYFLAILMAQLSCSNPDKGQQNP